MEKDNKENRQTAGHQTGASGDIGPGKKTGLYGCALLILGVVIVLIVLILTGIYNPFEGTEGIGP
jgi:hypothetical protein